MARLKQRLAEAATGNESQADALLKEGNERFARVPIEVIEPDPDQPRKNIGDIEELKASIAEHGIIQPIVVSPFGSETFRIIAGERRFSAAKALGMATVPAIIRTVDEHRRLEVQIIENIHRQELSPLEEAFAYRRLMDEFQLSQRQLAERIGKSAAGVNQMLRILSLPEDLLQSVQTSEQLSRSVLLEIAKQDSEEGARALWQAAISGEKVTVKTARAKKANADSESPKPKTKIPLKTKNATLTLVFEQDSVSPQDVVDALSQALREAKLALKASALSAPESAESAAPTAE
ncbi:MAG: ParB/RepB/Spo0J family partition protein [Armatimonadota bacterium]